MVDFAQWACACLPSVGVEAKTFLLAYIENRKSGNERTLEASPIAAQVIALSEANQNGWNGTAEALLDHLRQRVDERTTKSRSFPKTPRGLRAALNRIRPNLRAVGVSVTFSRQTGERLITLRKVATQPSEPSEPAKAPETAGLQTDGSNADADRTVRQPSIDKATKVEAPDDGDGTDGSLPPFSGGNTDEQIIEVVLKL
jgi:hypothetical protein